MSQPVDITPVNADWRAYRGVLSRRMLAFVIDYLFLALLYIPAFVVMFVFSILTLGLGFFLFPALFVLLAAIYFGWTLGGPKQASPGMQIAGIALRRLDGVKIDFMTAVVHLVLFWIINSVLTPFILLAGLFTDRNRLVHDLLLGTEIIRSEI